MRFGQPDVQRHQPGFGAESGECETERDRSPRRIETRSAHGVECEVPAAALQNAEAQQDGDRAEVRDQQIEKAGLANLGDAMLRGHQEIRRERHGLPRQHERISIIGEEYEAHAGEKQVILDA